VAYLLKDQLIMGFDFNEAREIIEAAKKRGAIREAGSTLPIIPQTEEVPAKETVLPEWLQGGYSAPRAKDAKERPSTPEWR
jgi:hypothetical protein